MWVVALCGGAAGQVPGVGAPGERPHVVFSRTLVDDDITGETSEWTSGSPFSADGAPVDRHGLGGGSLVEVASGMSNGTTVAYSLSLFQADRPPPPPQRVGTLVSPRAAVSAGVQDWFVAAGDDEVVVVEALLEVGMEPLPRVANDWFDDDPVFFLEQSIARLEALEFRKTETEDRARGVVEELASLGCVARPAGAFGGLQAVVTPGCLDVLLAHPGLVSIGEVGTDEPDRNHGVGIREGHQIQQFLDQGLNGETGSGRSGFGPDILVAVMDETIDADHPAWLEGSGAPSRLEAVRCWNDSQLTWNASYCTPETYWDPAGFDHGTFVMGQALADLTQNQDGNHSSSWEDRRTGMSTESHMVFYGLRGPSADTTLWPSTPELVTEAISDGVDVVIRSFGPITPTCGDGTSHQGLLLPAYLDGILWVNSAGNFGSANGCNISGMAAAPGVLTVGATDQGGDLHDADIASYSSRGGDANGRNHVDLVAIGGRQSEWSGGSGTIAEWDDDYGGAWLVGTSFAAPVVGGAAANFKHHLVNKLGASTINQPGRLQTLMLLMGDREGGGSFEMDAVWGAGRLAMRKFNTPGMDAPWAFHSARLNISDGQTVKLDGRNGWVLGGKTKATALPNDADEFRLVAWWYEPNLGSRTPADITVKLRRKSDGVTFTANGGAPQHRRIRLGGLNGGAWEIILVGTDISPSSTQPLLAQAARELHVAWFWEDSDRDDSDGPPSNIE